MPVILRPKTTGEFSVVGLCYVRSLACGEALLGPLPAEWRIMYKRSNTDARDWFFVNRVTGETTFEDPRLGPLPKCWRYFENFSSAAIKFPQYENLDTGEMLPELADPRMLPAVLVARGVELQDFIV